MIKSAIYTAHATSTGGRNGTSQTDDGTLAVTLATPKELGGAGGDGVNPEQLFAMGYSACFVSAMKAVAAAQKIKLPDDVSAATSVSIGENGNGEGFSIAVEMKITVPGVDNETAQKVIDMAHKTCPYSNATRGNIDVNITLA